MTDRKRILELATRWLTGNITTQEKEEFARWYNNYDDSFFDSTADAEDALKERMFSKVLNNRELLNDDTKKLLQRNKWRWPVSIAASLLILFSVLLIGWPFLKGKKNSGSQQRVPTLTLENGQVILLSSQQKGIIAGKSIRYFSGDPVALAGKKPRLPQAKASADQLLQLSTPKGLIYQVTLPDGSEVTLNAGSVLRYPSQFSVNERVVELEGEAFFDIKKLIKPTPGSHQDRMNADTRIPFKVRTAGQIIEVLGTRFDVNAYMDDRTTRTTLLEGRVKVWAGGPKGATAMLSPGEQAKSGGSDIMITDVDAEQFISWRNGYFYFDNASVPALMAQLQRWYDFDAEYETTIPDQVFSGKIPKNIGLQQTLVILRKAGINVRLLGEHQVVINSPLKNQ
ncbi:FecR family protein [Mucilaginibacter sp. R-33]|uniref:FecR family protein n=1 Tax=Mucilaginibacter sp. R-33 TaxID=3416711 RepID=UPI003CF07E9D